MYLWILTIFLFNFISIVADAQDPSFSQFYANPVNLNPAFTGTTELPRLVLHYRNQWPARGATFTTYSVSFDGILPKNNAGLGISILRDQELKNVINSHSASVSYSHHIKLGYGSFMTFGLQGGITLKQFNIGNLVFPSGIDQLSGEVSWWVAERYADETKVYPDFAAGIAGQHGEIYWGLAAHHLNTPNESVIEGDQKGLLPVKATLHAGARLQRLHHGLLSRIFTLSPNILYQHQGFFRQLNTGIYMIEKSFLFGGWYRNNLDIRPDAIIALAGIAREKWQFGYSFDITLSKLSNYSHGSHEISLTFYPGRKKEIPYLDKLLIPMI
jgi:type IX secretion system PorP/SprF family membrane protein